MKSKPSIGSMRKAGSPREGRVIIERHYKRKVVYAVKIAISGTYWTKGLQDIANFPDIRALNLMCVEPG
jgi:hypothetical protein